MCGRFTFYITNQELEEFYQLHNTTPIDHRYNTVPLQTIPVITQQQAIRRLQMMRWGLIPAWAKDESIANNLINARAETIAEKPSFRQSLKKRRCIIPISGFYEWKKNGKLKQPMYIANPQQQHLPLAGLWDQWTNHNGLLIKTCTLITVPPNEQMNPIHNRMPAILSKHHINVWLDENADIQHVLQLLQPYPNQLHIYPVSTQVNSAAFDSPELIEPTDSSNEPLELFD